MYHPKGNRFRILLKKIITLGFYDSKDDLKEENYTESYSKSIGEKFAKQIQNNLKVNNIRGTDIIVLNYSSPFAEEAQLIVNIIAEEYNSLDRKWQNEQAISVAKFLEDQSEIQFEELKVAEEKLKTFKEKERIFNLDGNASQFLNNLVNAESSYSEKISELKILDERYNFLRSKLSEEELQITDKLINDLSVQVTVLKESIVSLESNLLKNKIQYGENHEVVTKDIKKIAKLKDELAEKTKLLISQGMLVTDPLNYRQELINEILTIEKQKFALQFASEEYKKTVDKYNEEIDNLPTKQLEFARLEREYLVLSKTYTFMLEKLEESKISVASESGKIDIIDFALKPRKASSPRTGFNLIIASIFALLTGITISLLIEYFDNTLKASSDIENLGVNILGIVPAIGGQNFNKNSFFGLNKKPISASESRKLQRKLITREDPKSPISESYRSIRTSLLHSLADKKIKSMLVSSSGPGEGKTTTVANLAITFANLGKRTLLIDTDLRRPVLHKVFDLDRNFGITSYLSGEGKDNINNYIQDTSIENLSVICSGVIPLIHPNYLVLKK